MRAKLGFWLGLVLSLIILIISTWLMIEMLTLRKQLKVLNEKIEINTSTLTGYSTKKLDDMHLKINAVEKFIRTTPLVECYGIQNR